MFPAQAMPVIGGFVKHLRRSPFDDAEVETTLRWLLDWVRRIVEPDVTPELPLNVTVQIEGRTQE